MLKFCLIDSINPQGSGLDIIINDEFYQLFNEIFITHNQHRHKSTQVTKVRILIKTSVWGNRCINFQCKSTYQLH